MITDKQMMNTSLYKLKFSINFRYLSACALFFILSSTPKSAIAAGKETPPKNCIQALWNKLQVSVSRHPKLTQEEQQLVENFRENFKSQSNTWLDHAINNSAMSKENQKLMVGLKHRYAKSHSDYNLFYVAQGKSFKYENGNLYGYITATEITDIDGLKTLTIEMPKIFTRIDGKNLQIGTTTDKPSSALAKYISAVLNGIEFRAFNTKSIPDEITVKVEDVMNGEMKKLLEKLGFTKYKKKNDIVFDVNRDYVPESMKNIETPEHFEFRFKTKN